MVVALYALSRLLYFRILPRKNASRRHMISRYEYDLTNISTCLTLASHFKLQLKPSLKEFYLK